MRTVRLKLVLTEGQKGSLLRTMKEYIQAFQHAARWGYRNRCCDKRKMQYAIYHETKAEVPLLGAGLVQSSKNFACQALKRCNF